MAADEDLAARVRVVIAGNGELREVKMFGGLCFMLNGNMVAELRSEVFSSASAKTSTQGPWRGRTQNVWRCLGARWRATSLSIRHRATNKLCGSGSISPSPSSTRCRQNRRDWGRGGQGRSSLTRRSDVSNAVPAALASAQSGGASPPQVRTRLHTGGSRIRTIGPAEDPRRRRDIGSRRAAFSVAARRGEWTPAPLSKPWSSDAVLTVGSDCSSGESDEL